MVSAPLVNLK